MDHPPPHLPYIPFQSPGRLIASKCFTRWSRAVFLNRWAAARYRALVSIIPGRERPDETTICYKISLIESSVSQPLWDRGPVNSVFIRRGPSPNKFTHQVPFQFFLSSYIKLTKILIINYVIIIKSVNTLIYTVWHVDKHKIIFKLFINWTNEIL